MGARLMKSKEVMEVGGFLNRWFKNRIDCNKNVLGAITGPPGCLAGDTRLYGQTKTIEEHSTVVLFVVKVGDLAYKDESRFPTGPWCKEGDFVLTRAYAGTRFKIHGREFRIINDDTVEGVVQDPRGYTRA